MILGIDPGIRKLGYALIQPNATIIDAGILLLDAKNPTRDDQYSRMKDIHDFFKELLEKYDINTICIEKYYFTQYNKSNAEFVYGVRGIIMLLAKQHDCRIKEYTPIQIKKAITGSGKAGKMLMQKMVMKLFKLQELPKYHDAADALGLAWLGRR
jgi:crossover junction endodeoxyribonuclease RuvC